MQDRAGSEAARFTLACNAGHALLEDGTTITGTVAGIVAVELRLPVRNLKNVQLYLKLRCQSVGRDEA